MQDSKSSRALGSGVPGPLPALAGAGGPIAWQCQPASERIQVLQLLPMMAAALEAWQAQIITES